MQHKVIPTVKTKPQKLLHKIGHKQWECLTDHPGLISVTLKNCIAIYIAKFVQL